jgi:UDP-glucose:(heptosyl)LPS alpha-1,3-glucosyltransferase
MGKMDIDLIHTHERIFNAHIYSVHGIPHPLWVKQIRGKSRLNLFDISLSYVERRLISDHCCKHLLAVSSITAFHMQQAFKNISDRLQILPPGIDLSPFSLLSRDICRQMVLEQFRWNPHDRIFLFVGMNFEIKGLDQILKAISYVNHANRLIKFRLLVVGKGNIAKYSQLAESLGIRDDVGFTGLVETNIERYYIASDAFILLSIFDTFGLVVLEAMAAGLPVIISKNVGAKDVVNDGRTGYIVDSEDTQSIIDRIQQLADNDTWFKMRNETLKDVHMYTWDATSKRVSDIYALYL